MTALWVGVFISPLLLAPRLGAGLQRAGPPAGDPEPGYYWPSGRGGLAAYSVSPFAGVRDLQGSLAWKWHERRRYGSSPIGVSIDDGRNIYVTALDGVRKLSPDGEVLWKNRRKRLWFEEYSDAAALYRGRLYCTTTHGRVFALSMDTGEEVWSTKLPATDVNNGWVSVSEDTVITGSAPVAAPMGGRAEHEIVGLSAADGRRLWTFQPDDPVWNFAASFPGDGTFTYQDFRGKAYRNRISDGSLVWKAGGGGWWTDGTAQLGPNGIVYAVGYHWRGPGFVRAYAVEDGKLLWNQTVSKPPNNIAAIGRVHGYDGLTLVQPIGQQVNKGSHVDVVAMDAETGELRWIFEGPIQRGRLQAGDRNPKAVMQRMSRGIRPLTLPNPWSAPSIDAEGTVFIGSEEGQLYSLRDAGGDGRVEGPEEVSVFNTGSCFAGTSSPAIAPNMLVAANTDTVYVFKTNSTQ